MRALVRSCSSQRDTSSSRALRTRLLCVEKNRFLASCCVSVLPPRAKRPALRLASTDSRTASQSTPSWPKNFWSSDERTAWITFRDTRESGTQAWLCPGLRPASRASRSRWSMTAVRPGFFCASTRTSDREGRPHQR
jgi:hypothetical protein